MAEPPFFPLNLQFWLSAAPCIVQAAGGVPHTAIITNRLMPVIGLFPLNIVLFPNASYPLHIFEERYKTLVGETIAANGEFGINLVEGGKLFEVGCRVKVTRRIKDYPDGRKDIGVTGTSRYRVLRIRPSERAYITADIEEYEDEHPEPEPEILEHALRLYNELVERVYGEAEKQLQKEDWVKGGAAFRIAQKSGLDLILRQRLLEMRSESERLSMLSEHLDNILPKIRHAEQVRTLSRNDGYLKNDER